MLTYLFFTTMPVYASNFGSSKFAKGTEKLLEDLTTWLLVIAPIIKILVVGYYSCEKDNQLMIFAIKQAKTAQNTCRRYLAVSNEMDHKKWSTRITTAIISCVGVVSASLIVKLIVDYYK